MLHAQISLHAPNTGSQKALTTKLTLPEVMLKEILEDFKSETDFDHLEGISQKYLSKEKNGDPLASKRLVTLECYLRPENCKNGRVPVCKEAIFCVKMLPMQRKTDIPLQKDLLHTVKA